MELLKLTQGAAEEGRLQGERELERMKSVMADLVEDKMWLQQTVQRLRRQIAIDRSGQNQHGRENQLRNVQI